MEMADLLCLFTLTQKYIINTMPRIPGLSLNIPQRGIRRGVLPNGLILAASCVGVTYMVLFGIRGHAPPSGWPLIGRAFFKAIPALLLSAGTWVAGGGVHHASRVAVALLLCAAGDAALDVDATLAGVRGGTAAAAMDFFLAGLGCFLCAHVLLARAYLRSNARFEAVVACATALPGVIVVSRLWPFVAARADAGVMLPAIVIYACSLVAMFYGAVSRRAASTKDAWATGCGAALFIGSDAALAFDRFAPPPTDPESGALRWWAAQPTLVVLTLYWAALVLIALGGVESSVVKVDPIVAEAARLRAKHAAEKKIKKSE